MPTRLTPIITAFPLPVVVIDQDERIVALNPRARALFGLDATGRHYITVLRQPAVFDIIEQTMRDGQFREARYLGTEGSRDTTWRVTVDGFPGETGRLVLACFEDMTALEDAAQMRRDFVANVSHELRTPLTALLGFIETLSGAARDDPQARERFLGIMRHEAERMARLVDDLLSLSRVEADERVRPMTPINLKTLLGEVVSSFEPVARQSDVTLTTSAPEAVPTIPGDAGQLRQVLNNLIENAIKYGGPGGNVGITLTGPSEEPSLRGTGMRIVVSDDGDGIAAHHIPRLTERFYRIDSHRSRAVGGTGLGLAIVKHIVNRHRGRLRIESELGRGSRFCVILPV